MTVNELMDTLTTMLASDPSIGALPVAAASMSTEEIDEATQVIVATRTLRAHRQFDNIRGHDDDGERRCVWIRP